MPLSSRATHRSLAIAALGACLVAACGGGSDASATRAQVDTTAPAPATTTAPTTESPAAVTSTSSPPTTEPSTTIAAAAAAPSTTEAPFLDAAIRPVSFPGPLDAGTHRFWTLDPPVDITFGDGWSAGWELGDHTLAPNYTAAFEHPLTSGYLRLALWSMTGSDTRVDGVYPDDLGVFLRDHPGVEQLTEQAAPPAGAWSGTQFEFTVADEAMWIPLQSLGEPLGDNGLTVGPGRPQHWTVFDTSWPVGGGVNEPYIQLLVTWEVDGIDHSDPTAVSAATAEAAALVAPVIASITPSDVPAPNESMRVDWMSGGRDVASTAEIDVADTELFGLTATEDMIVTADDQHIYAIDPAGNTSETAATAYIGAGFGVTYGEGALWMPDFSGTTLRRLDPNTFEQTAEIEVGVNPAMASATGGYVWTADHRGGTVSKVDPATNERVGQFTVSGAGRGGPYGPVVQGDDLWAPVPQFDQLTRIDATTGAVEANLTMPSPGTDPVIIGDRLFLNSVSNDLVFVVDTNTNELIATVPLGSYPFDVIDIDGTPWVLASLQQTGETWLVAIDPDSLEIVDQVRVHDPASGVLDAFGSIWISGADGSLTRYPREAFVR